MEIFVTFLKEDAKEIFHLLIIICSPLFIRDAADIKLYSDFV